LIWLWYEQLINNSVQMTYFIRPLEGDETMQNIGI